MAHFLFTYGFEETHPTKLIREEMEIRMRAKSLTEQMGLMKVQLAEYRQRAVREILRAEAQRNFFLAQRYSEDKSVRNKTHTSAIH